MLPTLLSRSSARLRIVAALAVFGYLALLRTRHISEVFLMLGDQILYWRIAFLPWNELPIGGGPTSVGGTTLGPVFVWTVWAIKQVFGPLVDNLPHAGGIGLSVIQSAADAFLFIAIWSRFASPALALFVTLLVASAPFDISLTATIWNPPLAVAFIKTSIAFLLLSDCDRPIRWGVASNATAILALQSHSSSIFFVVPAIASVAIRELLTSSSNRLLKYSVAVGVVTLILEAPFLVDRIAHPGTQTSPRVVVSNVSYALQHPESLRPVASFQAVANATAFILLRPWGFGWFGAIFIACAAVTSFRARRDMMVVAVTVAPLIFAITGFSFWQRAYDHYWFLTMMPSAALTIGLALTAWRPVAPIVATCLALVLVAAQPARFADSMTMNRLPQYGILVRGSQEIRRRVTEVRSINVEFDLPPTVDREYLYEVLGGRVTPTAQFSATIEPTGRVRFVSAR
jgi:hypothetical protein